MQTPPRMRHADRHRAGDFDWEDRDVQMPSFDFRRSFTACGLAFPPDDFIT